MVRAGEYSEHLSHGAGSNGKFGVADHSSSIFGSAACKRGWLYRDLRFNVASGPRLAVPLIRFTFIDKIFEHRMCLLSRG
jgi:hypothetical protein